MKDITRDTRIFKHATHSDNALDLSFSIHFDFLHSPKNVVSITWRKSNYAPGRSLQDDLKGYIACVLRNKCQIDGKMWKISLNQSDNLLCM